MRAVDGGVELAGPPEVGYRANLILRTATRVLARVGEVTAREFGKLRHGIAALPWEALIAPGRAIKVSTSASRCRLYHTGAIAETVELGIADRLARHGRGGATPAARRAATARRRSAQTVLLRGSEDRFVVSIDSSGERLHRRGWRQENAAAPLRETLAAGLLALCDWEPSLALLDPMCGAGTIPIEAAAQALGIAPGIDRSFAFEEWPLHAGAHQAAWQEMRDEAQDAARRGAHHAPIAGADRSTEAVESARRNAERAGLASELTHRAARAHRRAPDRRARPGAAQPALRQARRQPAHAGPALSRDRLRAARALPRLARGRARRRSPPRRIDPPAGRRRAAAEQRRPARDVVALRDADGLENKRQDASKGPDPDYQ